MVMDNKTRTLKRDKFSPTKNAIDILHCIDGGEHTWEFYGYGACYSDPCGEQAGICTVCGFDTHAGIQ